MLKAINDQKSRLHIPPKRLSPLLETVAGYSELSASHEALVAARSHYEKRLDLLTGRLQSWRGNDPVTGLYNSIFCLDNIIEIEYERESIEREWQSRLRNKVPPGYKDSSKDDSGIGDFIIWKSILLLGERFRKDLVFVTGEEKSDWLVRSGGAGVYPRPELVDEYRRSSDGRSLALLSLSSLLSVMKVSPEVVDEIKTAETETAASSADAASSFVGFQPSELRAVLNRVFPGREKAKRRNLHEFRLELLLAEYKTIDDVEDVLVAHRPLAFQSEKTSRGRTFYTDVGIGREAMEHASRDFRSLIAMDFKTKNVTFGKTFRPDDESD